jgi:tetratricopeptide (TPR) repeat protein
MKLRRNFLCSLAIVFILVSCSDQKKPPQPTTSENNQTISPNPIEARIQAAQNGDAQAQFNLGYSYDTGQGVEKDEVEAVKWYREAADQNYVDAQCNLGSHYYSGIGVAKDYAEAAKWFRKAADQNNAIAQYNLGLCYSNGHGVAEDWVEAAKWFQLAADNGNSKAAEALKALNNVSAAYLNLPTSSQSQPILPVPSAPPETPRVTIFNVSAKVIDANKVYWKWAWKFTLLNRSSYPVEVNADVQFFDKDGYMVYEKKYGLQMVVLPANSSQSFTGIELVDLPIARNVANVWPKVEIQ